MTPEDFGAILKYRLLRFFPDLSSYCDSLDSETKRAWAGQFRSVDAEDLVAACEEITSGRETVAAYDRGQLAVRLLAMCRRYAARRESQRETREIISRKREMAVYGEAHGNEDSVAAVMARAGVGDQFREISAAVSAKYPHPTQHNVDERMTMAKNLARELADRVRRGDV